MYVRMKKFTEIVNLEESAEKFITNMTAKCTYLVGEDVLPKESLLYSEFMVRNAINNITVDGERLPVDVLEKIFKQLFLAKTSKVTKKTLERFLGRKIFLSKTLVALMIRLMLR